MTGDVYVSKSGMTHLIDCKTLGDQPPDDTSRRHRVGEQSCKVCRPDVSDAQKHAEERDKLMNRAIDAHRRYAMTVNYLIVWLEQHPEDGPYIANSLPGWIVGRIDQALDVGWRRPTRPRLVKGSA